MKSYSEDLRKKIVAAVERGMPKSETARLFGVSLSSIKRYVGIASSGESLAPKKRPGRTPKVDQSTKRLLDEDMKERPAANTIAERIRFLESVTGKRFSYSTIRRALKRLGWSRKKIGASVGARRVAESRLAGDGRCTGRSRAVGVRGRDGNQYFAFSHLRLGAKRSESLLLGSS
jgi:transposase